jgi:transposase InsO family protein
MCDLVAMPRRTYYRLVDRTQPKDTHIRLRDQLQRIALEWPSYGSHRLTNELVCRGVMANHKLVLRLMRTDNSCLHKRRFVRTPDSSHPWPVYSNRAPRMVLPGLNQLWVTDSTDIQAAHEFVYLALILAAFSRRCMGWALERHLQSQLTLAALQMAIATRGVQPELVYHSDRGVQYALQAYIEQLTQHGMQISMSRRGNADDKDAE